MIGEWNAEDHAPEEYFYFVKPMNDKSLMKPAVLREVPFRKLNVPDAHLTVSNVQHDGNSMRFTVESDTFAHAVHFGLDDRLRCSDEYFDLLPGERRDIALWCKPEDINTNRILPIFVKPPLGYRPG